MDMPISYEESPELPEPDAEQYEEDEVLYTTRQEEAKRNGWWRSSGQRYCSKCGKKIYFEGVEHEPDDIYDDDGEYVETRDISHEVWKHVDDDERTCLGGVAHPKPIPSLFIETCCLHCRDMQMFTLRKVSDHGDGVYACRKCSCSVEGNLIEAPDMSQDDLDKIMGKVEGVKN